MILMIVGEGTQCTGPPVRHLSGRRGDVWGNRNADRYINEPTGGLRGGEGVSSKGR